MPDQVTPQTLASFLASLEFLLNRQGGGNPDTAFRRAARAVAVGWEPLTVDLGFTPQSDELWSVTRLTMHGICMVNPSGTQSPVSGLFIAPQGTPAETLGAATSTAGWDPTSRGIPLPSGVVMSVTPVGDPATANVVYAYNISLTQSSPLIIEPGDMLRGVVTCNPGTANPGPGAGSFAVLIAMGTVIRRGGTGQ